MVFGNVSYKIAEISHQQQCYHPGWRIQWHHGSAAPKNPTDAEKRVKECGDIVSGMHHNHRRHHHHHVKHNLTWHLTHKHLWIKLYGALKNNKNKKCKNKEIFFHSVILLVVVVVCLMFMFWVFVFVYMLECTLLILIRKTKAF